MSKTQDLSTLKWIKSELDETIRQARQDLVDYMEGSGETALIESCTTKLHQIHGTLQMVQIYGASMLAEEMELVSRAIANQELAAKEEAAEAMLQGMIKLPDYLEKLMAGGQDHPLIVLPLLNDLRATRGESLLSEAALFARDLGKQIESGEVEGEENVDLPKIARGLRHKFHKGQLDWYRDADPINGITAIQGVLQELEQSAGTKQMQRFFRMVQAACTVPLENLTEPNIAIKLLVGKVDREIKRLINEGERPVAETPATEMQKNLLYYIASSEVENALTETVKTEFDLEKGLISGREIAEGREGLNAPNLELLGTLHEAIGADLEAIKDRLDLFIRTNSSDSEQLLDLEQPMRSVADTLGMMGQGGLRQRMKRQADKIKEIGGSAGVPDESELMGIAGDIIFVETALANLAATGRTEDQTQFPETKKALGSGPELPAGELDRLVDTVMREARIDMALIKEAIIAFINAPDKIEVLGEVPERFRSIAGAFEMMKLLDVSGLLRAIAGYVANEILATKSVPETARLNAFADAVSSVEYYMEAVVEGRGLHDDILDVAREALVRLGTKPNKGAAKEAPAAEPEVAVEEELQPEEEQPEVEEEKHIPSADKPALGEDISPEILEIFLEEANEELEVIREQLPRWIGSREEHDALLTFRRSFHTLKGSGRLVGAKTIGEFAWSIENMLNRVIDETLPVSDEVISVLEQAAEALPELIECQEKGSAPEVDVQALMDKAFALATPTSAGAPASPAKIEPEPAVQEPQEEAPLEAEEAVPEETAEPSLEELLGEETGIEEPTYDIGAELEEAEVSVDETLREVGLTLGGEINDLEIEPVSIEAVAEIALDPALLEIFQAESRTHLDTINDFLSKYREFGGRRKLDEDVARAYHTLHGSAHMAEVHPIAKVSAAMEAYLNDLLEHGEPADEQVVDLIDRSAQRIESIVAIINVAGSELPDWQGLLEDVEAQHGVLSGKMEQAAAEETEEVAEEEPFAIDEVELELEAPEEIEAVELEPEAPEEIEAELEPEAPEEIEAVELEPEAPEEIEEVAVSDELQPEAPAPTVAEVTPDPELVEIFLEEASELMDGVDHSLAQWGGMPSDREPVAELQRTLHTLKGGARLAGLIPIGDLAHVFESLLEGISNDRITATRGMHIFSQGIADRLMVQVEEAHEKGSVQSADDLIRQLEAVLAGELQVDPDTGSCKEEQAVAVEEAPIAPEPEELPSEEKEEAAVEPLAAEEAEVEEEPEAETTMEEVSIEIEEEPSEPIPEVAAEAETGAGVAAEPEEEVEEKAEEEEQEPREEVSKVTVMPGVEADKEPPPPADDVDLVRPIRRTAREQLRVNPELMDKMVNYAGEVSIFRSRLEQQNGALGFNLAELEQTVSRLRDQLRQLEIETEAQILFRYERDQDEAKETDEKFDPLEMDRFSTMQQLSRALMETVDDLVSINGLLDEEQKETDTLLLQQSRVVTDLQDGLLRTRMVAFSQLLPRLQRLVRQTCRPLKKLAEMDVHGEEMELDRTILDRMIAPLEHLLRNAVSHGIELPEDRAKAGKDETGRIIFNLWREGNEVVIKISDDGAGLNMDAIRNRAKKRGLLVEGAEVTNEDLMQFILEHGFSTAKEVSQIAGRGVGMDVVVSEVKQLGGSMDIQSTPGEGTSFIIHLPLTLAITDALLVQLGDEVYAVPPNSVEGVVRIDREQLQACYEGKQAGYTYAQHTYPLRYLGSIMGTGNPSLSEQRRWFPLLLVRWGEHRVALQVDEFQGHRQIVVKSVGPQLSTVRWFTGGTILADGRVALILDISALVRMDAAKTKVDMEVAVETAVETSTGARIMVVDDSITVRKVTSRLLERQGMDVVAAKDGVDAVAKLQDFHPDVMLLDIEMPRMDGFEVARHMKNSEELKDIPIIIITSRTGEKHREMAMELGVKRYLGKPYQEAELMDNINELLAEKDQ
jgi:chemosensory pili system protein ChpA (sensor histidine kinase/response regulator)